VENIGETLITETLNGKRRTTKIGVLTTVRTSTDHPHRTTLTFTNGTEQWETTLGEQEVRIYTDLDPLLEDLAREK
jgi:hypothetical protein